MRFILTLLMTSAMAFGFACQSASSSSTETKNENPAEIAKNAEKDSAEKTVDTHKDDDGHDHDGEAPRISLEDAKKDFDAGNVVIIDTRSANSFNNEHIKGAINVPAGDFENTYKNVPKDKKIIAYCS